MSNQNLFTAPISDPGSSSLHLLDSIEFSPRHPIPPLFRLPHPVRSLLPLALALTAPALLAQNPAAARTRLSDHLLRHAAFAAPLAGLIVSMRRAAWVETNLASLAFGPLTPAELAWLNAILSATP